MAKEKEVEKKTTEMREAAKKGLGQIKLYAIKPDDLFKEKNLLFEDDHSVKFTDSQDTKVGKVRVSLQISVTAVIEE